MHANKLNAENDSDTGGVLTEIVGSSPCATTVQQIERILGIDRDFSAALNLVEKQLSSIPANASSSGRLTPIERRWLASRLRELTVSEDLGLRSGAGIVALMYVTGMPLADVLQAAVGPEGTVYVGGAYRRTIRLPSNAYTPNADVVEQFLPRVASGFSSAR